MTKRMVMARIESAINVAEAEAEMEDQFMLFAGVVDGLSMALEFVEQLDED